MLILLKRRELSSVFSCDFFAFFIVFVYNILQIYINIFENMWKVANKNIFSYIGLILLYLALCVWVFELLLIPSTFINNIKYKDIYILSIAVLICLVFVFLLRRLVRNNKSKHDDWKLIWPDWSYYEWEFKNWKPHWMWIIKMKNWYCYEWEFSDWKRTWRFKKQVLTTWWVVEWEFEDNWSDGFDWIWKVSTSNWFVFEWIFKNWKLNWEWKMTTPEWEVLLWVFDKWELKTWKQILKNWEYFEWDRINWHLMWKARYYYKDDSYYEWECGDMWWQWIWTYVTKKWDKYQTEFPYEIINVFMYWLNSKIKEIDWDLKYIPKSEKEKTEEKNMYLKILEKWTSLQKEIARLHLEEYEKVETLLASIKGDNSIQNTLKFHKGLLKIQEEWHEKFRKLIKKHHIKIEEESSYYTYWQYFNKLNWMYVEWCDITLLYTKINEFLHPKNILNFVTKREKKEKERLILIDDFSDKYNKYIQGCLDWREYEKKFWNHNFKPTNEKKHDKTKNQNRPIWKD